MDAPRDNLEIASQPEEKLEDDVDALFMLPLAEFIGARNDLAARLKRAGRSDDANLVKALAKPSISAWAVNQLHWRHREPFDQLLATSQRFRQAQTSHTAADVRGLLDERRKALSHLSDLATVLLRDAGYNPAPDTTHRILTTLEAISGYGAASDGPTPGRLTQDVDPPGFGSLASFVSLMPGTSTTERIVEPEKISPSQKSGSGGPAKITPSQKSVSAETKARQSASPAADVQKARQAEEALRAGISAAKVTVQEARRSLTEVQSRAQRLEAAQKKADAEAKKADAEAKKADAVARHAEKQLREAEERFKEASAASQDAAHRAQSIAAEAEEAAQAVAAANRAFEDASKELESIQKSAAR